MPSLLKKGAAHFTVTGMAQSQMGLDTRAHQATGCLAQEASKLWQDTEARGGGAAGSWEDLETDVC